MPRRKTTETDALSTRQLSPNKAKASILHALKIKRPIFVWGGPGIGKSEVIHQIAKNIDAHVIDIRLSLWEPTDIKGIPYFNSKENNTKSVYIDKVFINDKQYYNNWLSHSNLLEGLKIDFIMNETPNFEWGSKQESVPFSVSN